MQYQRANASRWENLRARASTAARAIAPIDGSLRGPWQWARAGEPSSRWSLRALLWTSAVLAGCGGSAPPLHNVSASTTESVSTGPQEQEPARRTSASLFDTRASEAGPSDTRLEDRVMVPGTGVSIRAPRGAARMPVGAGFIDRNGRFQILVAVASGAESRLDELAESLTDGTQPVESENVTIDGRPTRLVIDTQEADGVALERVWTIVRENDHELAVLGAYPSNASESLRDLVRASILSTEWDTNARIEPERAAGFGLTAPEGLAVDPQVVSGLTYLQPGTTMAPTSGRPAMVVLPLPVAVPAAQRDEYCEELLLLAGPVGEGAVVSHGDITTESAEGCELFGTEEIPDPVEGGPHELATYAAIVFVDGGSFIVGGFVDAAERDTWSPRFGAAARTVRPVMR